MLDFTFALHPDMNRKLVYTIIFLVFVLATMASFLYIDFFANNDDKRRFKAIWLLSFVSLLLLLRFLLKLDLKRLSRRSKSQTNGS